MAFNKIKIAIAAGLLLFSTGTICSAKSLIKANPSPTTVTESAGTPELFAAADRVEQTKAQLETAKKQLAATKVLVKAAEADFIAAKAEREALALKTQAKSLADASGIQPAKAQKVEVRAANTASVNAVSNNTAPVNNDGMQRIDFDSAPTPSASNASEPMQLR